MDRSEAMKEALEIVKAQASVRTMTEDEITSMVAKLTDSIMGMDSPQAVADEPATYGDPKAAIKENGITCLVCGKRFKVITRKHLATHGLTPEEYREKYGYKKTQALACKSLARERRAKMKDLRLWEQRTKKPATEVQQ